MICYTGTLEEVSAANAQVSANIGLPFKGTTTWDNPTASYSDPTFFFIQKPHKGGWTREDGTHFTQEQMIAGVVNVQEQESQSDWFPPNPLPPIKI